MDPDQPPENPPTTTPAAPAQQPADTVTPELQARLDAEAKKGRDAAWAEARRHYEGKAKAKDQPKEPATAESIDPMKLHYDFEDAIHEMKLTKGQRQLVRDAMLAKRPADVEAFVTDYASKAGWSTTATDTIPTTPAIKAPLTARPVSDQGAPAGTPAERSSDVMQWSTEDVERFYLAEGGIVRHGDDGSLDLNDNRNAAIHKKLRDRARQALANVRVLLKPPHPR